MRHRASSVLALRDPGNTNGLGMKGGSYRLYRVPGEYDPSEKELASQVPFAASGSWLLKCSCKPVRHS